MAGIKDSFRGAGLSENVGYSVAFNDAGNQVGMAAMTAINGLAIDNGMNGQTQDTGYDFGQP